MDKPREFPNWEELYRNDGVEKLPWYLSRLDPDLEAALDRYGLKVGKLLDLGTGPGTQAVALAKRGFTVTAADISPAAVAYAARHAGSIGSAITFVQDDVLATRLSGPFDAIFDRGCFHVLPPEERENYVATIHGLLRASGWFFVKAFSHEQPGTEGPHRFTPEDLKSIFTGSGRFEIVEITETEYQGQLDPFPKALFAVLRRI